MIHRALVAVTVRAFLLVTVAPTFAAPPLRALPERSEAAAGGSAEDLRLAGGEELDPMVARTFPLLEARKGLELLAAGGVEGKIVLEDPAV
jgi:hypothetical protein